MTTRDTLRLVTFCCVFGMMHAEASPAGAQDVNWRQDYTAARHEATEKGRPLLIDVGTENCYWCKQLDLRTFSDPNVRTLLNERFVALKIDAQRHAGLADLLKVQNYPTLVFASAEGKILGYQEGFIEPAALQERLGRVLVAVTPADPGQRDLQEATRAVTIGDYARALALLKSILDDGKDKAVQAQARQLLQELEQQAAGRCAEARQLIEDGKVTQAVETVTELVRAFPGTKAAREGGQLLVTLASRVVPSDSRSQVARDLLQHARDDYRRQAFLSCLDRCEGLTTHYADLPEGAEAGKLAAEIRANPEWAKQACEQMGDRLGLLYLNLAESLLRKGEPQQAVFYLERVVQTAPNSRHAEVAQVRLAQIQGQPGRTADLKK